MLLSAILAFAAIHLCKVRSQPELRDVAEFYHMHCVQYVPKLVCPVENADPRYLRKLIPLVNDMNRFHDGDTLAATCLLRSYEVLAGSYSSSIRSRALFKASLTLMVASTLTSAFTESVDSQSHLLGSYSFLASQGIPKIGADLFSAGFWNYLQEDITVALMQKRRLKIDLSSVQMPTQMEEDDDWANQISFLLGKVINQCLGKEAVALGLSDWTMLLDEVESWKSSLPSSFTAFTPRGPTKSEFPSLWLLHGWHSTSRCRVVISQMLTLEDSRRSAVLPCYHEHPSSCGACPERCQHVAKDRGS